MTINSIVQTAHAVGKTAHPQEQAAAVHLLITEAAA